MDPWHDYLALPLAPLILVGQVVAFFIRSWWVRLVVSVACVAAIASMLVYVASLDIPADEGANIGEGVLALWLAVSIVLLVAELTREGISVLWRRVRPPSWSATSRV